jgi:hypothetical protein
MRYEGARIQLDERIRPGFDPEPASGGKLTPMWPCWKRPLRARQKVIHQTRRWPTSAKLNIESGRGIAPVVYERFISSEHARRLSSAIHSSG